MKLKILTSIAVVVFMTNMMSIAYAEKTIKAVGCFPAGTYFSKPWENMIKDINNEGKGVLQLKYLGGAPKIGSPFTLVEKISKGVFDITACTGAYYSNVLKEADAFKLSERSAWELRANGGWGYMNKLHQEKNLYMVSKLIDFVPFHLYLAKGHKIDKPDLKGLNLRTAPIYRNFFVELGATTQRSNMTQVYTYMENGTVQGLGWPAAGLVPGWVKVIGYRVDPGFYQVDIQILINLKTWNSLTAPERAVLERVSLKWERDTVKWKDVGDAAKKQQADQGIQTITFQGSDGDFWAKTAKEAGWAGVIKVSPTHGPNLQKLFAK